ncbi:MAG: hypothetical protein K0R10_1479 [Alphaproteobacteria bacterium]|jgi:hypothetical protein|nr:hypothetical protein [Alphaproteobacteria bacterium]
MTSLPQRFSLTVYAATLFLSAAIMFALQPMVGKMLLPLVGGTPAGWIVTMAFFQVMLLAGYFLAHALSRFSPRLHGLIYLGLMVAGCFFLPVHIAMDSAAPGAVDIFRLLTVAVAVPFIAVSATSSTLQRLFTTTGHPSASDPYFLYAASNLGSFTGLFLYPLLIESKWGLAAQAQNWFIAFGVLMAAAALCLALAKGKDDKINTSHDGAAATNRQRIEWILLSFFPSALLLAVTTHITTDVFSAPMIWILPLALYLLTFVIAFGRRQWFKFSDVARFHQIIVPLAAALTCVYNLNIRVSVYAMFCHLFAFGVVALACHMLLAQKRPGGGGRQLTEYYLMMSIGGALGGVLNAFILPVLLDRLVEYPVLMALSLAMLPAFVQPMNLQGKMFTWFAGFCGVMYFLFVMSNGSFAVTDSIGQLNQNMMTADVILFTLAIMIGMNLRLAFYGTLVLLLVSEIIIPRDIVTTTRNFYGVIKVFDRPQVIAGKERIVRFMYHGTTTHGIQIRDPELEKMPTAYFWAGGPVGDVFALYNPKNIAVVGLGTGTMNCFSRPDNEFTFLEIDEAVERVAREEFTFLKACTGKRPPKIIIGDGRLELAKQTEKYDLIALDAFSADTIPAHLLTLEAVKTYLDRLAPGGLVIFNLSNRYFTLANPLLRVAAELNLKTRFVLDIPPESAPHGSPSIWFAMAPQGVSLSPLDDYGWVELAAPEGEKLWTDDHTNLLSSLTFRPAIAGPRRPVDEKR